MDRRSFVAILTTLVAARGRAASAAINSVQQSNFASKRTTMNQVAEAQIVDAEDRLKNAMLKSDVATLEQLLAPDLIFTNFLGHLQSKEDDIAAYKSGVLKIRDLQASERQIRIYGEVGIVSVKINLLGTYAGVPADGDFRFTRVWALSTEQTWRVVAAHAGRIV
jgi:ketosteroid isomerase-like protein